MADIDGVTIGLIAAAIGFAVLGVLEVRYLRKKMKDRRIRAVKGDSELPDQAHNAIITTKAIMGSLERQGIRSAEVTGWIREAEVAFGGHNYRVVLELTRKAKDRLLTLKSEHASKGELAKLEQLAPAVGEVEITTKERLQKELAPNLLQSKFSIEVAGGAIEEARVAGRDVTQAAGFLDAAKGRFDLKDYDGALSLSRLSKRAADGQKVEAPTATAPKAVPSPTTPIATCPSCGAAISADDAFCRKCGARIATSACGACGAELLADDEYCPKCGARVSR
jgi:predicted RNA-binding Zn-ribbon protein involved in translation (DUF1610 family)